MSIRTRIGNALVKAGTTLNLQTYKRGMWFNVLGQDVSFNTMSTAADYSNAYRFCAPVSSILNRKAKSFSNGIVKFTDLNGKEAKGKEFERWKKIMQRPNILQTWNQFISQVYIYRDLYGCAYVLNLVPEGFGLNQTLSLWCLPNENLLIQLTGKLALQTELSEIIRSISFTNGGEAIQLPLENVLMFRDNHQSFSNSVFPDSRLKSLSPNVNNINAAYKARGVLISKKGAIGILSNKGKDVSGTIMLDQNEKEEVQKEFKHYGLNENQAQVIITNADLQWQQMSFPTKELMLFEEIEDDIRQLCDSYEYPMYLLGFKNGSTFSNVKEAKASLYQDVLLPDAEDFTQVFNAGLQLEKSGLLFSLCFEHIEVLQESRRDKAEAARALGQALLIEWQNNVITLNQWRLARGYEVVLGGDIYYSEIRESLLPNGNPMFQISQQ